MKRYIYKIGLLAIAAATFLVSCDEDTVSYSGENFVTLQNVASTSLRFFENAGTYSIPVTIAFPVDHDVTVGFTLTSDTAVEGVHYTLPGNSIVIPAGQVTANIVIGIIDNDILDDSKVFQFKLASISDTGIALGIANPGSTTKRALLINDDCTTEFAIWFGDLNVASNGSNVGTAIGDVNENGDCNILLVTGLLHPGVGESDGPINFVFTPNSPGATSGTVVAESQLYQAQGYEEAGVSYDIFYTATGTYNEVTKVLNVVSSARISLGAFADRTVQLTPVQ
ncbi:hypothetical protein Q765_19820 [Flavobacterium rivuli WB 3.3-2 = DSM 21788]|uniref:Calx-beta domain-containing protein n=1 Tax=Flavobacterium rivuli WB 3.3-2 = DSM 21788 TaxID=1121895 RepID=A0A0A2LXQ1_9FLAO|nr:Calx-beta domain-containing protein [Flavobacterium rivuli]KGO84759.1 hypothetical protein Q765_19820 [Flavobacterium rivuli WB 3.3-2 = DSM 21788]